jgi:hypothetical protein
MRFRSDTSATHVASALDTDRFCIRRTTPLRRDSLVRSRSCCALIQRTKAFQLFQPLRSLSELHRINIRVMMLRWRTRASTKSTQLRTAMAFCRCTIVAPNHRSRLRWHSNAYHESKARDTHLRWMRPTTERIRCSSVRRAISAVRASLVQSFQVNSPARTKELLHREMKLSTSDRCRCLSYTNSAQPSIAMVACLFCMRSMSPRSR